MNELVNGSIEVVALQLPMFIWVTARRMLMRVACKPKTHENSPQKIQLATVLAHNPCDPTHSCCMLKKRLPFYRLSIEKTDFPAPHLIIRKWHFFHRC